MLNFAICSSMNCIMTNAAKRFPRGRLTKPAAPTVPNGGETVSADPGISPQDFYQDLVARADVQSILIRLAQITDSTA
jgi:hypothetical protein